MLFIAIIINCCFWFPLELSSEGIPHSHDLDPGSADASQREFDPDLWCESKTIFSLFCALFCFSESTHETMKQ